ncbi:hypothetical protein C6P45_002879 [Maudiozyma exigua]|uniref:Uncharacterized protein n=1 Tax=Maudiozyma exigua TaxID=34358 RepID=A0A9P7BC32_MAUEX|nr:hypothetical protein C6P45_002879 [Kazachstania exigua]
MQQLNRPSALDSLFDENDNISNFKLSPSTSLQSKENKGVTNKLLLYPRNNKKSMLNVLIKKGTTTIKKPINSIRRETFTESPYSKNSQNSDIITSTRHSIRSFFNNFKGAIDNTPLSRDKNNRSDNAENSFGYESWDISDPLDNTSESFPGNSEVLHLPQLNNIRNTEHGLFYKISDDKDSKQNRTVNTKKTQEKDISLYSNTKRNNKFNEINTPPHKSYTETVQLQLEKDSKMSSIQSLVRRPSVISGTPIKCETVLEMDANDPYKFVFETPNKYSSEFDMDEKEQIKNNLTSICNLLSGDEEIKDISNLSVYQLSKHLLATVKSKLYIQQTNIRALEMQLETERYNQVNAISEEKYNELQKELVEKTSQLSKIELDRQLEKNKVVQLESSLNRLRLQEQGRNETFNYVTLTRKNRSKMDEQMIAELKENLLILSYFKDISVQFMKNLSQRSKNIISYQVNKIFFDKLESMNYNISVNPLLIERVACNRKMEAKKAIISQFFSENTDTHISNILLTNYGQLFRSNQFITQQLKAFRIQYQFKPTPQRIGESVIKEQKKLRRPYKTPLTLHEQQNILGNRQLVPTDY